MKKKGIRINTEIHFDEKEEADLIQLVQKYAGEKRLNRFLEEAIRTASASGSIGTADQGRKAFFAEVREQQRQEAEKHENELASLAFEISTYQTALDSAIESINVSFPRSYA